MTNLKPSLLMQSCIFLDLIQTLIKRVHLNAS